MNLLFDRNLSFKLARALADLFPGSDQVRLLGLEEADDRTVWRRARADGFAIVSLDADYSEMAALYGPPPKVVWLRCGNQPTSVVESRLRNRAAAILAFDHDDAACLEIY